MNHEQVGPEHLLLALIASDSAWVRRVLTQMDVHIENLASLIIAAGPAREGARPAEVTEGAELTDTINRAAALAASRNSLLVRPEHLLLAVAAGQGIGASSLELVGVTAARLRDVIDRMER
ncbi:MAG TPA: Clp protease N-terminal domain-containing protein [Candidatus Limnocylindria bacterium]|nr:Clp protease N-terminal domain-containing protein [Candidatus Limnocylindria bacterium]